MSSVQECAEAETSRSEQVARRLRGEDEVFIMRRNAMNKCEKKRSDLAGE